MSIVDERLKEIEGLEGRIEERIERIKEKQTDIEEKKTLLRSLSIVLKAAGSVCLSRSPLGSSYKRMIS
jgi:hypothetical protein